MPIMYCDLWPKSPKLNSRPVYWSQLYGTLGTGFELFQKTEGSYFSVHCSENQILFSLHNCHQEIICLKKFIKSKLPNRPNRPKPTQIIDSVSYEVLSFRNLSWFDLVTLTFHENSNHGWKNSWKSGVRIPAQKDQIFFVLCLFLFKFFTQNWVPLILIIFWYLFEAGIQTLDF